VISAASGTREERFAGFVAALVGELEPLELEHNRAYWRLATTGEPEHLEACTRLDAEMRLIFARREPYEFLRALAADGPLAEPLLERQLRLLLDAHHARQIPPELVRRQVGIEKRLEATFTNHRARLGDEEVTDNRITEILTRSDDAALRQRAWEASKQIGGCVEQELLGLVRLRNEGARSLGFENFHTLSLELDELEPAGLFALLDDLERGTRPLWEAYKGALDARLAARFRTTPDALAPWHYADPFFQDAPATGGGLDGTFANQDLVTLATRFFAALGLDPRRLLGLADLFERPGKSQHAFCMCVDRAREIRVLCNLRPNEKWMGTLLHELGHALYDDAVDPALPWLLRTQAHVLTTEASAMLFGRMSRNPAWLRRWVGAGAAGPGDATRSRSAREQLLVQTRWQLAMIHFERELYRDPERDLCGLWWTLVERFQGVKRPAGRDAPDWAAKIHLSVAPVYYQNYLLGEMLASQLLSHLRERVLGGGSQGEERLVSDPAVGAFLRERLYAPGKRWSWRELVARATGRPLEASSFVADLADGTAVS